VIAGGCGDNGLARGNIYCGGFATAEALSPRESGLSAGKMLEGRVKGRGGGHGATEYTQSSFENNGGTRMGMRWERRAASTGIFEGAGYNGALGKIRETVSDPGWLPGFAISFGLGEVLRPGAGRARGVA